jgi:predicted ATPase
MLTRLKVSGFKNLVDVDIRFGPFTCIAGANGVGKSNLLDAISFLSALADNPLMDAALSVRDEGGRTGDVKSLFHRFGDKHDKRMSFEAEMIVPRTAVDDLGQEALATITFLNYAVELAYRGENGPRSIGALELTSEELTHIRLGDAREHLRFKHKYPWRASAVTGARRTSFISTDARTGQIKVHQDGGSSGKPRSLLASTLPRTALSAANAAESPTATVARREMQSWRLLQLEPSALREADSFTAPTRLGIDGAHLPATLYHLSRLGFSTNGKRHMTELDVQAGVYAHLANRLSELIDDVREVGVDRDERRELYTLYVTGRDGTPHAARALSDGTLRFLALAVLELDPDAKGVICLEEPENGIHPQRIPAMLDLLKDIATDVDYKIGSDNPLRQVIVNTHSPSVVGQIQDDSLLMAQLKEIVTPDGRRFQGLSFSCLPGTWRASTGQSEISRGDLLAYLNPIGFHQGDGSRHRLERAHADPGKSTRVVDRPDMQQLFPFEDGPWAN